MPIPLKHLPAIKDDLIAGRYNLFLGSGASIGSKDQNGNDILSASALRENICKIKDLKPTSSLQRAYGQLDERERYTYITRNYENCTPCNAATLLPKFIWKRIYTLNIDDVIETAYQGSTTQKIKSYNYKSAFEECRGPDEVGIVHLHGWTKKASDGYIFSYAEYANNIASVNPWMNILSNTLSTEPFIVAGTSLEETDLEYFLSRRNEISVRSDRGPSFLIEPFPDNGTIRECERHGLELYKGTFEEFLNDLDRQIPARPFPTGLSTSTAPQLFNGSVDSKHLALFSRDFETVLAKEASSNSDLGFFVGREPSWDDIALNRDISRDSSAGLVRKLRQFLRGEDLDQSFLILEDTAGSGKTTTLKRIMFDLASESHWVFNRIITSSPDIELCSGVFNKIKGRFIIFCDDFADHATAMIELYRRVNRGDFIIVGAERNYRVDYIRQVMGGFGFLTTHLGNLQEKEALQLISQMDKHGLTGDQAFKSKLVNLSRDLVGDPIALATCRILNDFRPIQTIVDSLIKACSPSSLDRYVASSIASHCYKIGLNYNVLSSAFDINGLREQRIYRHPLPLNVQDQARDSYVSPGNHLIGDNVLGRVARNDPSLMLEIFCKIGAHLASYVNRGAIIRRTPEARLVGRLFDYDEVVAKFLPNHTDQFYLRMKQYWGWNSRYWEQVALVSLSKYRKDGSSGGTVHLNLAISHARHAVSIERHPLPMTTLGGILFEEMTSQKHRFNEAFSDGFGYLDEAIRLEDKMNRIAIHPFSRLFSGCIYFVGNGGKLSNDQATRLRRRIEEAETYFKNDRVMKINISKLKSICSE